MKYIAMVICLLQFPGVFAQNINFQTSSRQVLGGLKERSASIGLGDIDNDGDIDILITNRGRVNEICLNNGKGEFNETRVFGER